MKWIDAGDIKYWLTAKRRHCEETLPELVRRLISATAPTIAKIDFPSGDSVTTGGWDGVLDTPSISPFFPSGVSGWEMGVDDTPGKKADSDYDTRTADPRGLKKEESTFVFVTPRPWPDRHEWETSKTDAKIWKGVRVVAASGLETWLESAPAVALWLARQIGKAPDAIRDLESAWEEWSAATDPVMLPELVCAGRKEQIERVHQWIAAAPGVLEIQGDSPDEAVAFLFGAFAQLAEPNRAMALSRCLVVENIGQLRACVQFQQPLIITAPAECREAVGLAVQKGHHVFLAADSNTIDFRGRLVRLARPRSDLLEAALKRNGFADGDARRLARDSGASIPVLRRHIFRASIGAPEWSTPEAANLLLPVLLAGAWIDSQDGDRSMIETLAGESYTDFTKKLEPLLIVSDAPIRRIANVWMLKSPLDAWFLVARHLDAAHLDRFRQVARTVLEEVDPKYELEPDQRWAAAMYGKQARFSEWLHQGIVKSLVLLGVHGDRAGAPGAEGAADAITREVLASARTWQAWSSIEDITPLLAEASPTGFMEAVEHLLKNDPAVFVELMRDNGGMLGECKHAGLLWALEGLAWDPMYLPRATSILAALAKIDPGGSWSNRPSASLRDVFLPAMPQTYASPGDRLSTFDALAKDAPDAAWNVVEGIMGHGMLSAAHQFRWRSYDGRREPLDHDLPENYREYVTGLLPRINALIAVSPNNLIEAVKDFTRVDATRGAVLEGLASTDPTILSKDQRDRLVANLREVLHWINTYGGDGDFKRHVGDLAKALDRFSPTDVVERYAWLLGNAWPNLPEGEPKDYDDREQTVNEKREAAARLVLDEAKLDQILEAAAKVQYVGVFGHAFGKIVRDEPEDERVLDAALEQKPINEGFIVGYAMGRIEVIGRGWVGGQATRVQAKGPILPEAIALLFLGLPEERSAWTEVSAQGPAVEAAYWKRARGHRSKNDEDAAFAVTKLVDADRPDAALSIAGDPKISIPSAVLLRLLQAFLSFDPKKRPVDGTMLRYYLEQVFKQLYERDELSPEELARIEWPFAQVLGDKLGRHTSGPLAIHRVLQRDPSFFAQLVAFLYKRDDGTVDPMRAGLTDEQKEAMRGNARTVLDSWHLLPGLRDDGSIDGKELTDWVEAARKQCAETNHVTGGDLQIAEILARSPSDPDGAWPHTAIREVIERLQNQVIERHVPTAVYNKRGVTTRGVFDGGDQERALAKRYEDMAKQVSPKWPRTGGILNELARSYYRDAAREDTMTDLRDLRS
jgi:hypothetical protein